jgi:transposase-like protein
MPHKGILPAEMKIKLVRSYLGGEICQATIEQRYGIKEWTMRNWVRLFKTRGEEGLCSTGKNRKYEPGVKQQAVESYLAGQGSLRDICAKYDISSMKMLHSWIKVYNSHGDFKRPNSGGDIYMAKGRETTLEERVEIVSYCIANNKDYGKAVKHFGVSYQQVYGWVRKYETSGADGLLDRRGKRKDEASMTEVEKLRAQLKLKDAENLRLQMENDVLKKLEEIERGRGRH